MPDAGADAADLPPVGDAVRVTVKAERIGHVGYGMRVARVTIQVVR